MQNKNAKKTERIMLRVEPEIKRQLEAAAENRLTTLSQFMISAAVKESLRPSGIKVNNYEQTE